ncbi:LAFA_0C06106g1_1 [Lachancea sp. 'fantastica']|nr:LAFA_0C06106g1_1 [Lachancea sp. 'fantastica']
MTQIPDKKHSNVRFVTFNVNGLRTFFHYHPFSGMNSSLARVFDHFQSDIITFQELKTDQLALTKWGKTRNFHSFISIPTKRRGYSGVGCWVRIVSPDDPLFDVLQVVKAEEGITGYLKVKVGKNSVRYRDDSSIGIGGYDSLGIENETEALSLDCEGRCVMVELKCNMVVISTYCPANSMQTDDGEEFRLKFLKVLFRRIRNFHAMGKTVVLMGDINVCRDLIDQAEALKSWRITVSDLTKGSEVESSHMEAVKDFIYAPSRPARRLLNEMLADSKLSHLAASGTLLDTTRHCQGNDRLKMYTVWNTLKNSRPINYGSRIDYILVTSKMKDDIEKADIWPQIMGSDHCPVFADIHPRSASDKDDTTTRGVPPFEARFRHNLNNRDITSMFRQSAAPQQTDNPKSQSSLRVKKSDTELQTKKKQESIRTALKVPANMKNVDSDVQNKSQSVSPAKKSNSFYTMLNGMLDGPPLCKHGEEAILRTSKTDNSRGKKFWVCPKPKGDPTDEGANCDFFQWK